MGTVWRHKEAKRLVTVWRHKEAKILWTLYGDIRRRRDCGHCMET